MTDVIDDAQVHEAHYQRLAMAAHIAQQEHAPQVILDDGVHCLDCDDLIPAARMEILPYAVRCVDCQELWELDQRG